MAIPPATLAGLGDPIDLATSGLIDPDDLVALFGSSFSDTLISQPQGVGWARLTLRMAVTS